MTRGRDGLYKRENGSRKCGDSHRMARYRQRKKTEHPSCGGRK